MNQMIFAIGCLLLCTAISFGEEPSPSVLSPAPPPAATDTANQQQSFRIDFKIVQGERLLEHAFPRGAMIPGFDSASSEEGSQSDAAEVGATASTAAPMKPVKPETKSGVWNLDDHYPGLITLAEPALITVENRPASFSVRNKKSFQYLVPDGSDRFRMLKTPPHELGITVELTIRTIPGEPDAVELAPLKISQATLDGREPIAGLDLDVGKPIISKRSVETTARCVLGTPRCVPISTIPGRQTLLLVRVSRAAE